MQTCERCPREVIAQTIWAKASPNQRQAWLNANKAMLQGRGMCRACYLKAWKAGEIQHRGTTPTSAPTRPHPCARCGVTTKAEFCQDCVDVESAA